KIIYPQGVFKINETSVVYVPGGTAFLALAEEHRIPLARLFDFNDMQPQESVTEDALVYLQRKRKAGANETHIVAPGETLHSIAQAEGMRIENLLEYNHLKKGMQPAVGAALYLQKEAPERPHLTFTVQSNVTTPAPAMTQKSINIVIADNRSEEDFIVHVVQPKETVYSIAKRYAVQITDVVKWNDLPGTNVKTGQQLRIKKRA
ncbi:MAG: LysM peptidoglycan-binding domain-containing protein, partial [Flavisolibacter sp.]|nr:LysM peptidoglycan-binding domain-containing protein [Flavisolibacter sp.]